MFLNYERNFPKHGPGFMRAWAHAPIGHIRGWLRGKWPLNARFDLRVRSHENNRCYCPVGSTISLYVSLAGIGFWLSLSHGGPKRPCTCDLILRELGYDAL